MTGDADKRRLHFLHLGKAGGTAIKAALAPVACDGRFRIELHTHRTRVQDLPRGELFFFAIRDPISRFVSGFYSRQRQGRPRIDRPWTEGETRAFGRFATANALAEQIFEDERAADAMRHIGHVNRSYWYWFADEASLLAREADVFFIARQEHLDEDFRTLAGLLQLPPGVTLPSDEVLAHRNPQTVDRRLSHKARANLLRWYVRDFAFIALCERIRAERRGGPDV